MKLSIVFLVAVMIAVSYGADNDTLSVYEMTATSPGPMMSSPVVSPTNNTGKPTSSATTSSALFGLVLSFSFACLLKSL